LRMDRCVAPFRATDGPRTSDVIPIGTHAVVASFAEVCADGMYRRQIEDIETHPGDVRKLCFDIAKGAEGSGKQFVPRTERGLRTIDLDRHLTPVARDEAALAVAPHQ